MHSAVLFSLLSSLALLASGSPIETRQSYPFSQIVAFGDELSDNGNGSYAHGMTGNPALVYGYGTWTNGPVAISYLSSLINKPLVDYAFGGCCGGGKFGATIDNTYTASDAGSPCVNQQISNYTSSGASNAASSLGFVWAGQNDLSKHTDAFWLGDSANSAFVANYASITTRNVQSLISKGVKTIMVANIYPKQLAPVTRVYLCGTNQGCFDTWGQVIQNANAALKSSLASLNTNGVKIIYYDSFGFLTNLYNNAAANGFYMPLTNFCDGDPSDKNQVWNHCWNSTTYQLTAPGMFWTNYVQPTTQVNKLMANDMLNTLNAALGK